MMKPPGLPPMARNLMLGLMAVAILAGVALLVNRGSQVRLEGSILKVRVVPTDDNACLAVVDFRVKNPSSTIFQVKQLKIVVTTADGTEIEGQTVPQLDLDRVLEYHKVAGTRYTPMLKERDRLNSGVEEDRTAAAGFTLSEKVFQTRKGLTLKIQDADGMATEFGNAPPKR
ncbi:hypothetical protein [Paludibaculum fermentans]|uniref:Uncharacterized protein n=1 Tax=Paludibaculum fermentans TaxID=1473598 RepID=A0A7S7NV54_PALFE|nr:hypothetical protein [Paludibaculum fermentans]QOY90407.1 hypothetical protein IRI77_10755 [Paludibaculum fermentans]